MRHPGKVRLLVYEGHLLWRRRARFDASQAGLLQPRLQENADALRPFRVSVPGVMFHEPRVEDEARLCHGGIRYLSLALRTFKPFLMLCGFSPKNLSSNGG